MHDYFFWGFFVFVLGSLIWRMVRHGGFRAAMFGATIRSAVGEVRASRSNLHAQTLKVYRLADDSRDGVARKAVGIEVVSKSVASYQMFPIALTGPAALELAKLLEAAAKEY